MKEVDNMKKYIDDFIEAGLARRNTRQNFILLKELVSYVRGFDLTIKVADIRNTLLENGWVQKRMSILTETGHQSKNAWVNDSLVIENSDPTPAPAESRMSLEEEETKEALRMIDVMFEEYENIEPIEEFVLDKEKNTLLFSNNALKEILEALNTIGRPERISSIIRSLSDQIIMGEPFYGTSSRTTLFKNYYRYTKQIGE